MNVKRERACVRACDIRKIEKTYIYIKWFESMTMVFVNGI